ncbi:MAG TPA: 2-hydroxychromene-2-carboxylate isomerase [Patescibacteria group bacterium]|nr:2-hydroxychromene-2-carboxylate isomerase [Patescibacteria group bacterium]
MEFWYDFASTYSYPAAMRIEELAGQAGVAIEWRPFLLGPLFQRQGWNDSPFNIYPARGRYMWRDLERICARNGLPFRRPTGFPRHSVLAARVASLDETGAVLPALTRALFRANFAEDRDIGVPEVVGQVLAELRREAPGLPDPARLLARAVEPGNKERLRARTEEAWEAGLFGAPSFVVDGELFWGQDRLEEAFAWTRGDRPVAAGGR